MLQIFFQWLLATKIKTFGSAATVIRLLATKIKTSGSAATVIRHILRRNKLTRTNKVNDKNREYLGSKFANCSLL